MPNVFVGGYHKTRAPLTYNSRPIWCAESESEVSAVNGARVCVFAGTSAATSQPPRAPGDAPQTNSGVITYGWARKEDLSELEAVNLRLPIVLRILRAHFQRANNQTRTSDVLKHQQLNIPLRLDPKGLQNRAFKTWKNNNNTGPENVLKRTAWFGRIFENAFSWSLG